MLLVAEVGGVVVSDGEFDIWERLAGGGDGAVEGVERGEGARPVVVVPDAAVFENVELRT